MTRTAMTTRELAAEVAGRLHARLAAEYDPRGFWTGRLCSSAVAGAIAVTALARINRASHAGRIAAGLDWISAHRNPDGGWGDSPESPSNLTATLLVWNALHLHDESSPRHRAAVRDAEAWLAGHLGSLEPAAIVAGILRRYGNDRTFAAPILTMTALCGRLGPREEAWNIVPQLPFELARAPHTLYKWLDLTVVSYALPALIAIGLVRHRMRPTGNPLLRRLRDSSVEPLLRTALRMQPDNGGYEEATPLTAFVALSLTAAGLVEHPVVRRAKSFLVASMREDGSWPIDTNLATWVTTLAVNALAMSTDPALALAAGQKMAVRSWLLGQQYSDEHPLTRGEPGGWSWSDLPGCMPDADDTCGVLIALRRLGGIDSVCVAAAERGIVWLARLQNRDGGIPTFARGWGKLPFDRSCPDITAHALQAYLEWEPDVAPALRRRMHSVMRGMVRYLRDSQTPDGTWSPLWFGNQNEANENNFSLGTARAVASLRAAGRVGLAGMDAAVEKGTGWLVAAANEDGGWGGAKGLPSTMEETGMALAALAGAPGCDAAVRRGLEWMAANLSPGSPLPCAPVGLYFARLWYSEKMYPVVFGLTGALSVLSERSDGRHRS
jgi:squalene-hopene/tetraprenyl-beta-curcumene cyclase